MLQPKQLLDSSEVEFVEFLRTNPDLAAEMLLIRNGRRLKLSWYQRYAVRDSWHKSFYLLVWNRGAAKTTTMAIIGLLRALLYPNHTVLIFAASYRQAMRVFDEVVKFWNETPLLQESSIKPPSKTPISCELLFKHNSKIKAMPLGDGSKILGERGNTVLIDEAARVPAEIIDVCITPMLNVPSDPWAERRMRNLLIMGSTAFWQFNHLFKRYSYYLERVQANDARYGVLTINIFDCPSEWLDVDMIKQQAVTMAKEQWLQENLSIFTKGSEGFYPAELIESIKSPDVYVELKGVKDGIYIAGVDVGRNSSDFVVATIKLTGDTKKLVYVRGLHKPKLLEQVKLVREVVRRFEPKLMVIDQGGGGLALKDALAEPYKRFDSAQGNYVIDPPLVEINTQMAPPEAQRILLVKQFDDVLNTHLSFTTKADFENKRLLVPRDLPDDASDEYETIFGDIQQAMSEFLSIEAIPLSRGTFRFVTPNKKAKKDRYSAVLYANYGTLVYNEALEQAAKRCLAMGFGVTRSGEYIRV
jgi:hypothetical protein